MKKIIKIILFFICLNSFSQEEKDKMVYLDSTYSETTVENHKYYRIIKNAKLKQKAYEVIQYYSSGKIESKGFSKSNEFFEKVGEITTYYENGNLKSLKFYKEYYPEGKCSFWHENGIKKAEGEYVIIPLKENKEFKTSKLKIKNYWDKDNIQKVINGEGELEDDDFMEIYDTYSISSGKIKNGVKVDNWLGYSKPTKSQFSEIYKDGELVSGVSIDKTEQSYSYSEIFNKAKPSGGIEVFYRYIASNLNQPEDENFKGGKILLRFYINKEGAIYNVEVLKGISPQIDQEAIKLIENFNKFLPAELRGIKISTTYIIPIILQANN